MKANSHPNVSLEKKRLSAKMSRPAKAKRGQFVIIAALLIAALTLATAISIHNINIHRQSITYRPADEFLLGTTSDLNRVAATSLATFTDSVINYQLTETEASTVASESIGNWKNSTFASYSNYGIRMKEPPIPTWSFSWNGTTSYSLSEVSYNLDVDSYGFKSWMGRIYKYVQLQIYPSTIQNDSTSSSFIFQLKESTINEASTVPTTELPETPDRLLFRVGNYSTSEPFKPADEVNLQYLGNGNYNVTFNQIVNIYTHGIKLDLATPADKIWVSANYFENLQDWSTLHLITNNVLEPNYLYTPEASSFYSPPLSKGQPRINLSSPVVTRNITTAQRINITVYLSSVPPKAAKNLVIELGFNYKGTYYPMGTTTIQVLGKTLQSYSGTINVGDNIFTPGFAARTIPQNSTLQLTLTISFENPSGTGKVYFDGDTPSQINLY
jgi:hypothetical protein